MQASSREVLNLGKGYPDPSLLPRAALAEACEAAAQALRAGSLRGLEYGAEPVGSPEFLAELAAFLGRHCPGEAPARADSLMLTNGVSHGLDLACGVLSQPGEAVLIEAPSYYLAVGIFRSRGLEVVPVPTDGDGLVVEAVEAVLDARPPGSAPVRFLYTVPTNHNPTGTTLPAARRRALVELARRRNFLILADEVYHLLDWHPAGERPARMACFDSAFAQAGRPTVDTQAVPLAPVVVSVSSFTKILAPGLRVGWIEAAPSLVSQLAGTGYLVSGGCVTTFATDAVLTHVLRTRSGDTALARLVAEYKERSARMASALEAAGLPALVQPRGGYFAWVPLNVDASAVLEVAQGRYGVSFMDGSRCDSSGDGRLAQAARLCFAFLPAAELEEAIRRLGKAVEEVRQTGVTA